jgi:Uma2 family endonuclease
LSDPAFTYDKDRRWTYADYKDWELKPGERFELINGAAYAMTAPGTEHQLIATAMTVELGNFLKGKKCKVIAAPFDVRLFYEADQSDDTVVQPDLVVIGDPEKLGKEGCHGAPDLVVEILSPSNTAIEMLRKRELYREAGVQEYWVIDPEHKIIVIYRLKNGQYELQNELQTLKAEDTLQSEALPGLEIKMETIFG